MASRKEIQTRHLNALLQVKKEARRLKGLDYTKKPRGITQIIHTQLLLLIGLAV